jgi:uncharacterized repeat protein (TIGR01451 family)
MKKQLSALVAFRHQDVLGRIFSVVLAFAIATLLVVVGTSTSAQAADPCPVPGSFEIDGDMTLHTCTPAGDDWNTPGLGVAKTTQGGTYKTAGKDDGDPSAWQSSGSTPDKTDFERAYATSRVVNGRYFVYVAWERTNTTGTQGYAIEIDNAAANTGADGTPQPNRSHGTAVVYISSVGSSAPHFDGACTFTSQSDYGQTCTDSNDNVTFAINTATINDPLAVPGSDTQQVAGSFFEVALDVTGLTGIAPSCPGAAANSVYLRSITGQTHNGNLKGYMAPLTVAPDSTCVAPTVTTQTQHNDAIDGLDVVAPDTAQHDVATVTGTTAHPAPTGDVSFSLCGPTSTPTDCTTGGVSGGTNPLDQHASNSTAQSDDVAPHDPGWYCWRAEFTPDPVNGDNPFLPATATTKTNECFKVAYATPTIATVSSARTEVGAATGSVGFTTLGDTATLSDVYPGADLSAQHVTFTLYGPLPSASPGADDCTADTLVFGPQDAGLALVDGAWTATAPTYQPTVSDGPGYYTWVASYAGDEINASAAGACGAANETQHLVGPLLSLTKGTPHSTITAGDDIVYDVNLANTGAGTASGVVVTDVLPILAGGASWSLDATSGYNCALAAGAGSDEGHQVLRCDVGDLDPSSLTRIAEVSATTTPADCGDVVNSAGLRAEGDVSQTAGPVTVHVQCPGLKIAKTADADSVNVGSQIGFEVRIWNDGAGTASGVTMTDPLPTGPGISWVIDTDTAALSDSLSCGVSAHTLTCTGSLAAGASQTVHVISQTEWTGSGETEVNSCLGGTDGTGVYDNTAQVTASNVVGPPSASADTQVLCPDLHVTKAAGAAAVNAGSPIGFTITASNTGAGDATGALLHDPLPGAVAWSIDASGTAGPLECGISNRTLTCSGTLPAGATETVQVTAPTSTASCATYDNTATVTATNTPQAPTASASTTVVCPDVVVSPPRPPQVSPPAVLPNTGGPDGRLVGAGLVLLLGGGTLVAGDRRRRRRS